MTIEELADLPWEKLKALSLQELEEILSPYYKVTRPEMIVREKKVETQPTLYLSPQKQAALELLEAQGVDMGFLKRRVKR